MRLDLFAKLFSFGALVGDAVSQRVGVYSSLHELHRKNKEVCHSLGLHEINTKDPRVRGISMGDYFR